MVERELRFTTEDVAAFAAASGDRNPLHTDAEFAAATAFGSPVAHGALIAIAMLGALADEALAQLRSLRVSFAGPLLVDASATVSAGPREGEPGAWEAKLTARGRTLARVLARARVERRAPAGSISCAGDAPLRSMRATPAEPSVCELRTGHTLRGRYEGAPELREIARRLDAGALDPRLLEGLAWTSYVVGMELPGVRSLLAGIVLDVDSQSKTAAGGAMPGEHSLAVGDHDERTGQLTIDGSLATRPAGQRILARIQCFALPLPPYPDPAALRLDRPVEHNRGAVVIAGGSRGFGASLALALLGLGYEVHVAYASSRARARELARLAGTHEPRLHLERVDVRDADALRSLADAASRGGRPLAGVVLNAARPPLAMGLTAQSAEQLADYVHESLRLVAVPLGSLLPLVDEQAGWVLFCSSAAVAAPPRDWPHYISAKAAVEGLASWVAATKPRLRTVVVRAPKMRTDMTGTPSGRIGAASADAIASWTAERLAGGSLEPGLSTLEPEPSTLDPEPSTLEPGREVAPA
jgi:NAD(P)-dependent dehydrogenase (short-subunit alcohol dehydrogenase family)/acyl dehydratase